jgi:CheY-like chemotaxis protein
VLIASDEIVSAEKLRILVVEDHADTAYGLKMYFNAKGHEVYVALDMKTARQIAAEKPFDILLSDLLLPDGNGWDLLRELKARGPIRAIAVSGYNSPEDIARSHEAGFLMHLAKPVAMAEVNRVFAEAMKADMSADASASSHKTAL